MAMIPPIIVKIFSVGTCYIPFRCCSCLLRLLPADALRLGKAAADRQCQHAKSASKNSHGNSLAANATRAPFSTDIPQMPVADGGVCAPPLQQASPGVLQAAPSARRTDLSGFATGVGAESEAAFVDHGRTSAAGIHHRRNPAHAGSGSGRSRSIRRMISANRVRGTATSANWNTR